MPFTNPHPLYSAWQGMKRRCYNPNFRQWAAYGGRGIKVCDRWRENFAAFAADMGPRPVGLTLDRINNDGDYEPSNCRWADRRTQQRNQRRAVYVTIEGRRHRAIELAERSGHKTDTIIERASRGLTLRQVLSKKRRHNLSGLALGGEANGARNRAATHCIHGHKFTPKNTYVTEEGWRRCRTCHREKMRRRSAAQRAAGVAQ